MPSLPPEVLEQIINATQDVNPAADRRTLLRLLLVSKAISIIVKWVSDPIATRGEMADIHCTCRRLLYRHIHIKNPLTGQKLCRTLQTAFFDRLGQSIRTLSEHIVSFHTRHECIGGIGRRKGDWLSLFRIFSDYGCRSLATRCLLRSISRRHLTTIS